MCSICLHSPCLPGCPNAPEPKPVLYCAKCGYGIYKGDKYVELFDGPVCEDCLEEYTVLDWLDMLDESLREAE